jgi:hypothetical protein
MYACRILISLFLASLSGCFINGNGQAQGDARDNGSGNASGNGSGNGDGNDLGSGNSIEDEANATADGNWDITTNGGGAVSRSEMVVTGGKATGFVALSGEGKPEPGKAGCTRTKDRTEFQLKAVDDSLSGSFNMIREWSGSRCPKATKSTFSITGVRTERGKSAFGGDWSISGSGADSFTVGLKLAVASDSMVSIATSPDLSFVAQKR